MILRARPPCVSPVLVPLISALMCLLPGDQACAAADIERMQQSTLRILCRSRDSLLAGSGFVIGADRTTTYLVTNQHVAVCAKTGEEQELSILLGPRKRAAAELVWADARKDLAIIGAKEALGRPAATLADTALVAPGTPVIVVGFPGAADRLVPSRDITVPSVTRGHVSRIVPGQDGVTYFEHTAVTLPGSSGGPAYDEAGHVIGVISVRYVNAGIGAAVDVAELLPHLQAKSVPYTVAAVTPMSISTVILAVAVVLLLAAGGILVATPSGRALLFGPVPPAASDRRAGAHAGRIRILGGPLAGTDMPVLGRVILGRDPAKAQIVFPEDDTSVSRRHCEIAFDSTAEQFEVRDLGSRNGTFIANGQDKPRRLVPDVVERVAPGQRILVGSPRNSLSLELG